MNKNFERMSSTDMAKALRRYGQKNSVGLLLAVADRLERNANILATRQEQATAPVVAPIDALTAAVRDFVDSQSRDDYSRVLCALDMSTAAHHKAVMLRALYDAARTLAQVQGCPAGKGPHCVQHLCDRSYEKAVECWFAYLREVH